MSSPSSSSSLSSSSSPSASSSSSAAEGLASSSLQVFLARNFQPDSFAECCQGLSGLVLATALSVAIVRSTRTGRSWVRHGSFYLKLDLKLDSFVTRVTKEDIVLVKSIFPSQNLDMLIGAGLEWVQGNDSDSASESWLMLPQNVEAFAEWQKANSTALTAIGGGIAAMSSSSLSSSSSPSPLSALSDLRNSLTRRTYIGKRVKAFVTSQLQQVRDDFKGEVVPQLQKIEERFASLERHEPALVVQLGQNRQRLRAMRNDLIPAVESSLIASTLAVQRGGLKDLVESLLTTVVSVHALLAFEVDFFAQSLVPIVSTVRDLKKENTELKLIVEQLQNLTKKEKVALEEAQKQAKNDEGEDGDD